MDKTVMTFQKNSQEEVQAGIQEFKGRHYASVRVYVENDAGEHIPTKKGITVPVELLPELARAVRLLADEAVKQGLVAQERFEGRRE
ncbi:MAG: transcriptional coactivator p15/PC4 family protein [Acidobacteriota bacterium]